MIEGKNVFDEPIEVKRKIGYLPETPPLYHDMTVESYLRFVCEIKGVPHREINSEIERVSQLCGIKEVSFRLIRYLSKGYRQRVGLAQALIGDPPVLILDEPTSGLDPAQIREVRELIRELAKEHTVILSTHILPEVTMICNRVVIIHKGRIRLDERIDELEKKSSDVKVVKLELSRSEGGAVNKLSELEGVEEVKEVVPDRVFELELRDGGEELRSKVLEGIISSKLPVVSFSSVTPSLEDIFIDIIAE